MRKRLHLSLLALVGSVILFVVTSLAWFTVSEFVNINPFSGSVGNQEIDYVFYESDDGITYTEVSALDFSISMPGDIKYFRVIVTNPDTVDYNVNIFLSGINDINTDGSTYTGPSSLKDVIEVVSSIEGTPVINDNLNQLVAGGTASLTDSFDLLGGESKTVDFSLSILGTADNTYQNLGIEIDELKIYFDTQ